MEPESSKGFDNLVEEVSQIVSDALEKRGNDDDVSKLSEDLQKKLQLLKTEARKFTQRQVQEKNKEKKLDDLHKAQEKEVKLNVGGTIFPVSLETLTKDKDSMLYAMFSGRYPLLKGEDGAYFIDRDPTYFRYILNYLRYYDPNNFYDTEIPLPESEEAREEILKEADYYQLQGLAFLLQGKVDRERQLGPENIRMRTEENEARALFLNSPKEVLKNPYLHLIDVFANKSTFVQTNDNGQIPFMLEKTRNVQVGKSSVVDSLKDYQENFMRIAEPLKGINWNNVFVAGGSVLASLMPGDQSKAFSASDIDLFLYGLTAEQATEKIKEIYNAIKKNFKKVAVVRTSRTLTFVPGYPNHHIQLILRLYGTPAEILLGFDLDCVGVGYDGSKVWALPRARRALNFRYNIADPSRQTFRTTSYEYRLWKYSKRGFAVAVPGFRRERINPEIYLKTFAHVTGFAKLLLLEERDNSLAKLQDKLRKGSRLERRGFKTKVDDLQDKETFSLLDQDVIVGPVIDYNHGMLLPYSPSTSPEYLLERLQSRVEFNIENGNSIPDKDDDEDEDDDENGPPMNLFFIFADNLESVLDTQKFSMLEEHPNLRIKMPRFIEYIGSLSEYIRSLPFVEDNWYRDAYKLRFTVPSLDEVIEEVEEDKSDNQVKKSKKEEEYSPEMKQLIDMGFTDIPRNRRLLKENGNDVNKAVQLLMD